ncbi:MAG: glycine oxidase ThiO [Oceanospirillaceae bacterium]|nr:glycine oxidase ThiO [Oceanospirillaceae bacterium]
MKSDLRIGIAGGGLLGRLCAWRLSLQGHHISLFEASSLERPAGACWTAAGMISPLSEVVATEREVYDMGLQSLAIWPRWIAELEASQGRNMHYRQAGSVVVAHPLDEAELRQFHQDLRSKLGDSSDVELLDASGIQRLEPDLADHFQQGLYLKSEADINNRRLLGALLDELRKNGANLHENCKVQSCEPFRICHAQGTDEFDLVIDTRGLGAKDVFPGLRGVRGEVLIVATDEIKLNRPVRMMHPRYKLYAVPKPNGQIVIGATEIESEDMSPISLQSSMELSSALYALNPAFAEARIVETSVNCRPALMNNLPYVESQAGLLRANGLHRHGYLLSPVVVSDVLSKINQLNQNVA